MVDKSMAFLHFRWCPTCVWLWCQPSMRPLPYHVNNRTGGKQSESSHVLGGPSWQHQWPGSELSELETGERAGAVLCPSQDQASSDEPVLAAPVPGPPVMYQGSMHPGDSPNPTLECHTGSGQQEVIWVTPSTLES